LEVKPFFKKETTLMRLLISLLLANSQVSSGTVIANKPAHLQLPDEPIEEAVSHNPGNELALPQQQ